MKKTKVMRLKLSKQIPLGPGNAGKRARISGDNIATFFTHLYAAIYGGKVRKDPWGKGFGGHTEYSFSPDIERQKKRRTIYTEVKTTSKRSSQIHSPLKQEANNLCELVMRAERKENPLSIIEYGLFKYGNWYFRRLMDLNNSELVQALAKVKEKRLVIVPFNYFLFLASIARHETRDQRSSDFSADKQEYHITRGDVLTSLLNNKTPLTNLNKGYRDPALEHLLLEDVEVERGMTSQVEGSYQSSPTIEPFHFTVEPFPFTRYFVPERKYGKLVRNLVKYRAEIAAALGIRDVYQELKDAKQKAKEEKRAKLKEELKGVPF